MPIYKKKSQHQALQLICTELKLLLSTSYNIKGAKAPFLFRQLIRGRLHPYNADSVLDLCALVKAIPVTCRHIFLNKVYRLSISTNNGLSTACIWHDLHFVAIPAYLACGKYSVAFAFMLSNNFWSFVATPPDQHHPE